MIAASGMLNCDLPVGYGSGTHANIKAWHAEGRACHSCDSLYFLCRSALRQHDAQRRCIVTHR